MSSKRGRENTTAQSVQDSEETLEEEEQGEILVDSNIAMHCVFTNSTDRLMQCFDNAEDPYKDEIMELIKERNDDGKNPLDMACILGRLAVVKELLARGVDPNAVTARGYTALHYASAWGKVDCIKTLVEANADFHMKTMENETPCQVAARYGHQECVDYLDWADVRFDFQACIRILRETLADPEKIQGRLNRDEKKAMDVLCNERDAWIENGAELTTQDFIEAKAQFEEHTAPIWQKINEPLPEKEVKK